MGRSNEINSYKSKIFISPFLYIGWLAIIFQLMFVALNIHQGNLICMIIALSCFVASMIHSMIHSEKRKKEQIYYILKMMDEMENRGKRNMEKLD